MKDADFELLITSVRQAGRIKRSEIKPARKIEVQPEDVKAAELPTKVAPIAPE